MKLACILFITATMTTCNAVCRISLRYEKDLGPFQPLLLRRTRQQNQINAIYYPLEYNTELLLNHNDDIYVHCPGSVVQYNSQSLNISNTLLRCVQGKKFMLPKFNLFGSIRNITCEVKPERIYKFSGKKCLGGFDEVLIGFKLRDGRFINHLSLCYDKMSRNTLYSEYNLTSQIYAGMMAYPRPSNFVQNDFYNLSTSLNNLYSRTAQKHTLNKLLGLDEDSNKYINESSASDNFLARGHLTAKVDFVYGPQQLATFQYVNVAPQFQIFNGNNWEALERSVRDYAAKSKQNLTVFTGTHGVLHLPHEDTKELTPIHLYQGAFKAIPVPKYYWKVLYNPKITSGIAFVGLNNPYHFNYIDDVFCKDVCEEVTWRLSWNQTRVEHGYSFCCGIDDFRATVNELPEFTVDRLMVD